MNLTKVVSDYIREQWINFRRALVEPEAREELLGGALMFFYEPGTTRQANAYADADLFVPHTCPVIANSSGEFPPIFLDKAKPVEMQLRTADGTPIITNGDARTLCGPTVEQAAQLWNCLMAEMDAIPCRYPDLRDSLSDWIRQRASSLQGE